MEKSFTTDQLAIITNALFKISDVEQSLGELKKLLGEIGQVSYHEDIDNIVGALNKLTARDNHIPNFLINL